MQYPDLATPISPLRQRLIGDMNMRRFSRERSATISATLDGWRPSSGGHQTQRPPTTCAGFGSNSSRMAFPFQ